MLEQFFSQSEVNAKLVGRKSHIEHTEKKNQRILLSGPSHSGKTSLLLQFAYNCAIETSATVVFLCKRNNFEKNPPFLPQSSKCGKAAGWTIKGLQGQGYIFEDVDVDPSSDIFERVHIKYLEDDEGIRKYFAAFHMHSDFPRAVILDDFCDYFDEGKCREKYGQARGCDVAMVRTLALCCDAINHANDKLPSTESCKLLISDSHIGDTPRLLYIYQRWLPCILTVKAHDGFTFTLRISNIPGKPKTGSYAKYSTALQYLTLVEMQSK